MKVREHIEGNEWSGPRTVFEDEFGNRGEVRWPRCDGAYGLRGFVRWYDAQVHVNTHAEGDADEVGAYAEFALKLAHVGKTLDLAFADDKAEAFAKAEKEQAERDLAKKVRDQAQQWRCEHIAQFYMQMVRVQREGHSSHAKGELQVLVLNEGTDDQSISTRMWINEGNGNRWRFEAHSVAKFEVKDGNRYEKVDLTPMAELEATAREELSKDEEVPQVS